MLGEMFTGKSTQEAWATRRYAFMPRCQSTHKAVL